MARTKNAATKLGRAAVASAPVGKPMKSPRKSVIDVGNRVASGGVKRAHRWHPGTVSLREIRRYQKSTELLIKKAPFQRIVREIAEEFKDGVRFEKGAIEALQHATEAYMIEFLEKANAVATEDGRVTLSLKDVRTAKKLLGLLNIRDEITTTAPPPPALAKAPVAAAEPAKKKPVALSSAAARAFAIADDDE
jgi:histone H3